MNHNQLLEIGLDFTVSKRELYRKDESLQVNEVGQLATAKVETPTKWYATVNDATNESLGVVGDAYHVTQNSDVMAALQQIAGDEGYTMTHSGPIDGGKRNFVQMKLGSDLEVVGNDELVRYVVATWGHDGKHGVRIGFGNKVVSCQNQFYQFHNNASIKLRHSSTILESLKLIPQIVAGNVEQEEATMDKFRAWDKAVIWKEEEFMKFSTGLWKTLSNIDPNVPISELTNKYSSRKLNSAYLLQRTINLEMQAHGQSLWGLFNGVTYYTNHQKSVPNRAFGRDESILLGGGAKMNEKAFQLIDKLATDTGVYA
jgi:hypothetical protein|tara:strand:+ start:63 stop:1004 length:942 start_codon:yes stop_codon:yes gene_type:complete